MKTINIRGQLVDFSTPKIMGILNVTPDSFYMGSRFDNCGSAVEKVSQMIEDGTSFIDIGGQSTSPTSTFCSAQEERTRLEPFLKAIEREFPNTILSIDTFYSEVAKWAVEKYGVSMVNDVSGGDLDVNMFKTIAELKVPYILMHMRGTPQTMQQFTLYENLLDEIILDLSRKMSQLYDLGVNDIIIDPGFGFSKTLEQNYELIASVSQFEILDAPLLVGISRKSMIYKLLNIDPADSLNGTSVLNSYALMNGANILRVHDVKEAVECVKIVCQIAKSSAL